MDLSFFLTGSETKNAEAKTNVKNKTNNVSKLELPKNSEKSI